ncbi:hypothetical protein PQ465_14425 [Sphingobacterium oryzagri]|uniref:Uncharacterized protein n=1 Tax=Sphingobacterium oryzagri TaxID=3025669 RepID=A0ABY7WCV5_9SPHI|nr:hypothetical protein [Sphingobacterium sp. KACC 22765]WDF67491.1 hypothetical protein PQ465_14425 [Sphingobacterium sp. KACC 22765]
MKTAIIPILLQLQQVFSHSEQGSWARRTQRTIQLLEENQYDQDLILDNYIGSGMESLHFIELENDQVEQFNQLRADLLTQNQRLKSTRNSS